MTCGRWTLRRDSGAPRPSPRGVTRGESTPRCDSGPRAKVDWLNATFPAPFETVSHVIDLIAQACGHPISAKLDGGLFGFTDRHRLFMHAGGVRVEVGSLAMGGEAQNGRWLLQLTGQGCQMVSNWRAMRHFLEGVQATVTRLDLALDFLEGEYTVDDAMDMLEDGKFTSRGRPPVATQMGAWHAGATQGRTLYVGKAKNGKMLRVYEKGKQLGDAESEWTRYEVQLGNRDREIPLSALTNPDAVFAGAYPALEPLIHAAADRVSTISRDAVTNLAHQLYHLKRCYGKTLHQAHEMTGVDVTELVEEVRIVGTPRRVKLAGAVTGLDWPELQAQLRSYDR